MRMGVRMYLLLAEFKVHTGSAGLIKESQRSVVSTIIVVILLIMIMKDQLEQLRSIGIRAVAIRVNKKEGEEEAAENEVCEIVYGSSARL